MHVCCRRWRCTIRSCTCVVEQRVGCLISVCIVSTWKRVSGATWLPRTKSALSFLHQGRPIITQPFKNVHGRVNDNYFVLFVKISAWNGCLLEQVVHLWWRYSNWCLRLRASTVSCGKASKCFTSIFRFVWCFFRFLHSIWRQVVGSCFRPSPIHPGVRHLVFLNLRSLLCNHNFISRTLILLQAILQTGVVMGSYN